jgi:hypothetical protein
MTTINQKSASAALVPVPSLAEQASIVSALLNRRRKASPPSQAILSISSCVRSLLHELMRGKIRVNNAQLSKSRSTPLAEFSGAS